MKQQKHNIKITYSHVLCVYMLCFVYDLDTDLSSFLFFIFFFKVILLENKIKINKLLHRRSCAQK